MVPQLTLMMAMCCYMAWSLRDVEIVTEDPEEPEDFVLLNPDGTLPEEHR